MEGGKDIDIGRILNIYTNVYMYPYIYMCTYVVYTYTCIHVYV